MTAAIAIVMTNVITLMLLMLIGEVLAVFFIPRLELAKGINGTPHKISAIGAIWGLSAFWKTRDIKLKSLWIIILGLQTLITTVQFGTNSVDMWKSEEKLILPAIYLLISAIIALNLYFTKGEKHPSMRAHTYSGIVGAIGLAVILYGITPYQEISGLGILGYSVKWVLLAFLYIALVPFLTLEPEADIPKTVSRISQAVWALGLAMIFWPPQQEMLFAAATEQLLKAQVVLFLHDVSRAMFANVKTEFFENYVLGLVVPLIFISALVVAAGL